MRKVQDFYFKKAKQDGFPARSIFKLEEAQKRYRLLRKGAAVLDLGCCPGSWSLYAARLLGPTGVVVGVDLQPVKKQQVAGGAPIHWLQADFTDPAVGEQLRAIRPWFDVVLSDAAPKTTGNKWADQQHSLDLARTVLGLAQTVLASGGHFYCKVFEGEDFKEFVDSLRPLFRQVRIVKPKSSRSQSREVFVLGQHYRRD